MNWNSLNKMVLRCFKVTVPDPVLLRCYQGSETTTNQKQGGLQSLSASSPPPLWCCLLRPLFTVLEPALSSSVLLFFPCWPNRKASLKDSRPPYCDRSGPAWLGGGSALGSHLSSRASWEKKGEGLFFFLRKESRVLQSLLTWQAVS